ncbi:MAG: hypothetical protein JW839_20765 [Candidatus Lokiarchaeota archaeon]|nr:hypothetical protein [Candidatus Lokiarchaeota archaeon]
MDPSRYATFSSLDRSRHAERRLLGKYIPAFDDIRAFVESGTVVFVGQKSVVGDWRAILGSVVAAISWDVLQGLNIVMALLDDPEFGRDIKWYFSPAATKAVDFKLLLLFVETSLEMMLQIIKDPSIVGRIMEAPVADVPALGGDPGRIRSPSFCLAVEPGDLVPRRLGQLAGHVDRASAAPPLSAALLDGGSFEAPLFSWAILADLRGCVVRDAARAGELHVRLDRAILSNDAFSKSLLLMVKVQLEAITGMIAASLDTKPSAE